MTHPQPTSTGSKNSANPSVVALNHAPIALKKLSFMSRWFNQRLPIQDSIELTQRNIYILPTAAGFMLGVTLLLLLLTSINYQDRKSVV